MRSQRLNIVSQNEQTSWGIPRCGLTNLLLGLQESFLTIGSKKRIQLMLQYIDITSHDVLLDVGGNTGKITEVYGRDCKEVVVLEPKHAVVEYGRTYRPNIKFVEAGAENIPLPCEHFDKVVACTRGFAGTLTIMSSLL